MTTESKHLYPFSNRNVSRTEKEQRLHQKAKVIWFTGLSGSGKTTLALALERNFFERGYLTLILDGDKIRTGINSNLGFSATHRIENIRRIAEIAKLTVNSGVICICAFVSPTHDVRNIVRTIVGENDFLEIYVSTPLEVCESRDDKGLYKKARAGEISEFTGISAPFDIPQKPVLSINTSDKPINDCVEILLKRLLPEIAY